MLKDKLIIIDYSGTLSLEATQFAGSDDLMKHLEASGLKALGIDSPAIFWEQMVNPTWIEGSTTPAGYKKTLENRMNAILHQGMSVISHAGISQAVALFVDLYLRHSRIDRRWKSVLITLNAHPSVSVVIATDHYAEATEAIIGYLREWGIQAVSASGDAFPLGQRCPFAVANSADLGVHKADPRFWEILRARLNLRDVRHLLMIDDFGYNEQERDRYAEQDKVKDRQEQTIRMLSSVFTAEVQVVPFMIEKHDREQEDIYGRLITKTAEAIERFMAA